MSTEELYNAVRSTNRTSREDVDRLRFFLASKGFGLLENGSLIPIIGAEKAVRYEMMKNWPVRYSLSSAGSELM